MMPTPSRRGALGQAVVGEQVGVVEQAADHLGGVEHLDHARPVVGQRGVDGLALAVGDEGLALELGERAGDEVAVLHPRQRAHLVPAPAAPSSVMKGNFM
jgi:hypothetical protein